jgi:hypothetical protein
MRELKRGQYLVTRFLLLIASSAWAEVCKGSKVPRVEQAA